MSAGKLSAAVVSLLVKALRARWPEVAIVLRGDADFYCHLLLSWCVRHDVLYIVGYRSYEALLRECKAALETLNNGWHWLEHDDVDSLINQAHSGY